ncbi:hypothetical protein BFL34_02950 [Clavibacter michiganensis]|uniref:Uncharacterized protein n=1 Tax=Clavibacter michiganensis TaxID=28447 RepID=A0A251Y1L6_9MICO|nr:hypothetical protein [Clavibacter michiganensis]OUE18197.1 hypothetical protein BFL34_02950 [Clavibacter michiganensis]
MTPTPQPSTAPAPVAPPLETASLGPPEVALILSGTSPAPSAGRRGAEERADAAVVARAEARGELVRLRAGVHVRRTGWEAVSARERHLLRIRALARVALDPVVLGGASAAAVHGLPRLAPWPALVTLLDVPGLPSGRPAGTRVVRDPAHGRSRLVRGAEGVRLPGLAATALAASHEAAMAAVRGAAPRGPGWYAHGLVALDHALAPTRPSPVTRADLERERGIRGPGPWSRRAELLVRAADGAARCPLESVARGVAHEVGLAPPAVGVAVGGHGRLALAWAAERVGLRIVGRGSEGRVAPGADADTRPAGQREVDRWRVVVAGEGDVLGAGRLRALLLHAGLEPERRAAHARPGELADPGDGRSRRSPPLGCAGE